MLGVAQSLMVLIVGTIMVLILSWTLVQVHTQAKRLRRIERQLKIMEKAKEEEALKNG